MSKNLSGQLRDHQRMSVEDTIGKLILRINETMNRLTELWDEVHMEKSSREVRVECAYLHFYTLLHDIIKSEEDMVQGVQSDIEVRRLAIADLSKMLKTPKFNETFYPKNSIALLKALDKELNMLLKKRDDAVEEQLSEFELLKELCNRINKSLPFDQFTIQTTILSPKTLTGLKDERQHLLTEVEKRVEYAIKLQADCRLMYKALNETMSYSGEQQNLLNNDFSASFTLVNDDVIQNLKKLHSVMRDAYNIWLEQMSFNYSEVFIVFKELSEKCCVEQCDFSYPEFFDPEIQDQSSIEKLKEEVNLLKNRYKVGKKVFEAFQKWRVVWQEKINREQESLSSKFYNNRGCQLNFFLKRQRQLELLVPHALQKLKTITSQFLAEGGCLNDILIEETSPDEYAEFLISEHKEQMELHRAVKSSANKHNATTSLKNSGRRLSSKIKVPSGKVARRRLSMIYRHKLSIISPIKTPRGRPNTSPPKLLTNRTPLNKYGITMTPATEKSVVMIAATATNHRSKLPRKVPTSVPNRLQIVSKTNLYGGTPLNSRLQTPLSHLDTNQKFGIFDENKRLDDDRQIKTPLTHWKY